MKTYFPTTRHWQAGLICLFLSFTAQGAFAATTANYKSSIDIIYYGFAVAFIVLVMTSAVLMQRAKHVLNEHGRPLYAPNSSIFKGLTKSKTLVAVVMTLLVLLGIYLVITYKAN